MLSAAGCKCLAAGERSLEPPTGLDYDRASAVVETIAPTVVVAGLRKLRRGVALVAGLALLLAVTASAAVGPVLNMRVDGRFKTFTLRGKVQFGRVRCVRVTSSEMNVFWGGSLGAGKRPHGLTGEIDFQKPGKQSFGPKGSALASLVVDGDYKDRLGSGFPHAGGTGTLAKNRKSGAVSITLLYGPSKIRVQGSWTCG
jgi:hypothetical protein